MQCSASVDVFSYNGYTPLHTAAAYDCVEIAMMLVACGATPDLSSKPPGKDGDIPMDLAQSNTIRLCRRVIVWI